MYQMDRIIIDLCYLGLNIRKSDKQNSSDFHAHIISYLPETREGSPNQSRVKVHNCNPRLCTLSCANNISFQIVCCNPRLSTLERAATLPSPLSKVLRPSPLHFRVCCDLSLGMCLPHSLQD